MGLHVAASDSHLVIPFDAIRVVFGTFELEIDVSTIRGLTRMDLVHAWSCAVGIAALPDGLVAVVDSKKSNMKIVILDPQSNVVTRVITSRESFMAICDIVCVDHRTLAVSDFEINAIHFVDMLTGSVSTKCNNVMASPGGMTMMGVGTLVVCDRGGVRFKVAHRGGPNQRRHRRRGRTHWSYIYRALS